jgi:hypothetical protein
MHTTKRTIQVLTEVESKVIYAALMTVIPKLPEFYHATCIHTVMCDVSRTVSLDFQHCCPYSVSLAISQLELVSIAIDDPTRQDRPKPVEAQLLEVLDLCLPILRKADTEYQEQRDRR